MTSVDGRIDCPMVGQLTTDEYYIALDRLGKCSKLSGRVTTVLECPAVKEETAAGTIGTSVGHEAFPFAGKRTSTQLPSILMARFSGNPMKPTAIR